MLVFLAFLIVLPIITVFLRAVIVDGRLDLSYAAETLADPDNVTTLTNSLILGALVVLVTTLLATPLAFILARTRFARMKWLDIVMMIPFMTPPYIASMGWIQFMQKRGLFQQLFPWTGSFSENFFSLGGLVLVMSFHSYPFMTGMIKNAILNINGSLEESARVSGGRPAFVFRKITMPLLTGNYAIAMLMVFVKTLSEYGTPATLGNRIGFRVFTTDIHRYASTSPIDFGKASALSSVLVLICMIVWLLQTRVTARHTYSLVGARGGRQAELNTGRGVTIASAVYIIALILCSIGVPYFSIIATSLIKLRGYGLARGNFTFAHYIELFTESPEAGSAILTSLFLAVSAATIASVIGVTVVTIAHKSGRWKRPIEGEALLPQMIPNIVFAIGLMILWNKLYDVLPLYNTLGFMILVYVVMFLPYSVQYTSSAMIQIGETLSEAGQVFGGSRFYIFRRIVLPLVMRGVLYGWMMIFIISFRELVASSLTSPPNVLTVSTYIVSEFEQGSVSNGMCMAVICVAITTTLLIILNAVSGPKRGRGKN